MVLDSWLPTFTWRGNKRTVIQGQEANVLRKWSAVSHNETATGTEMHVSQQDVLDL